MGHKSERHSEDVHVIGRQEPSLLVDIVISPPEPPAYYLLAEELAGEGSQAHYVGHSLDIPALSEHAHRYDVLEGLARLVLDPNGIDDLSEVLG